MERNVLTKTVTTTITKRCGVCNGLDVTVVPIELVANNGIAMKAVHYDSGITHTWLEYDSSINATAGSHGVNIQCPKCGDTGNVYTYTPNFRKHPERVRYFVKHGLIDGTWGKQKQRKFKRCYISDPEQRIAVLKKLGRYIPEKDVPAHPKRYRQKAPRIQCPICLKPNAVKYTHRNQVIYEHVGETPLYYISKGQKKPRYRRCNITIRGNGGTNA